MNARTILAALALLCAATTAQAGQVSVERTTFSADGAFTLTGTQQVRRASFTCNGTWGGGTVAAQVSVNGSDFVSADEGGTPIACSADCTRQLLAGGMGPYRAIRLSLTGAGAPSLGCVILLGE